VNRHYELIHYALLSNCDADGQSVELCDTLFAALERHITGGGKQSTAQFDLEFRDLKSEFDSLVNKHTRGLYSDVAWVIADLIEEERREGAADAIRETATALND
jgi:hypothetical protein